MKGIKKLIAFIFLVVLPFSAVSCGLRYIPNNDEKAFEKTMSRLFEALDNKDKSAICELFSPAVREQDTDLQEKAEALIDAYEGPADYYDIAPIHGSESIGDPGNWACADTTIPVRSGDKYYFFQIDLMYKHYDEDQIGITQLEFYTADEMCIALEGDVIWSDRQGLYLHTEKKLECEVRTIDSDPLRYTKTERTISIDDVKSFAVTSSSFSEFVEKFGEANARSPIVPFYYFELPGGNGKPQYLKVSEDNGIILSISIVDDFKFVEMIYDNEDYQ